MIINFAKDRLKDRGGGGGASKGRIIFCLSCDGSSPRPRLIQLTTYGNYAIKIVPWQHHSTSNKIKVFMEVTNNHYLMAKYIFAGTGHLFVIVLLDIHSESMPATEIWCYSIVSWWWYISKLFLWIKRYVSGARFLSTF